MNFSAGDAWSSRRTFLIAALLTLAFRFWLAAVTPFTGDEAYFIWWGQWPDWGFYDHPPMIGWWLALLLQISHAEWWLRLPIIIQPVVLGLAVAAFLKPRFPNLAWGAATLFLLAPANVWNVFITTDTPLVYFSVLAGFAWLQARRAEDADTTAWRWYVLAGLGLAGAVLSKYFAALLGFAFLVDTLYRPSQRKFVGLFIVYALTVPGIAMMAWWNAGHCWSNVMFNFYNRHHRGNTGLSWQTPLLYLSMMMYLLTPLWFWYLQRQRHAFAAVLRSREGRALAMLAIVPLALFVPLSIVRTIGLHWVLGFMPFLFLFIGTSSSAEDLRKYAKWTAWFSVPHFLFLAALILLPTTMWKDYALHDDIIFHREAKNIVATLRKDLPAGASIMARAYTPAALLSYHADEYLPTFGQG
ncbi:MAG: glycosyltransferase family 39 protein, partial [Rhodocyclaceae bacterium]|nr:glycosyltransferase family 39 protein [Rhodocyclaceae bacterium]